MERKREQEKQVLETSRAVSRRPAKKVYRAPELVEWGSINDLTAGAPGGKIDGAFLGSPV
jgi:hypothetical protein